MICIYLAFLITFHIPILKGSIWNIQQQIQNGQSVQYKKRYMFSKDNGPTLLYHSDSFISFQGLVHLVMTTNASTEVVWVAYASDHEHRGNTLENICDGTSSIIGADNSWSYDVTYQSFNRSKYLGTQISGDNIMYQFETWISFAASVKKSGWYGVDMAICNEENNVASGSINGKLLFKNPYGYIPAELFGYLPIEFARVVAYILLGCILIYFYCVYQDYILSLHFAVLAVYLFALVESILWQITYQILNQDGTPYCCPFPSLVIASLSLQIFRQTCARTLLLVVALGYGISRPKLSQNEWIGVGIISVLYFFAAGVAQVTENADTYDLITDSTTVEQGTVKLSKYLLPALLLDGLFLTLIFTALSTTQRVLRDHKQIHKLSIYTNLSITISIFAVLFALATFLNLLEDRKFLNLQLDWQWPWIRGVLWEGLNFAIIVSISLICLPTPTNELLVYSTQIPTEDPDEYENHEPDYEEDGDEEDRGEYKNLNRPEEDDEIDFDFDDRVSGQMQMMSTRLNKDWNNRPDSIDL